MIDPCKEGKCISYPICINKKELECELLEKHIKEYAIRFKPSNNPLAYNNIFKLNAPDTVELWTYVHSFLPKIVLMSINKILYVGTKK